MIKTQPKLTKLWFINLSFPEHQILITLLRNDKWFTCAKQAEERSETKESCCCSDLCISYLNRNVKPASYTQVPENWLDYRLGKAGNRPRARGWITRGAKQVRATGMSLCMKWLLIFLVWKLKSSVKRHKMTIKRKKTITRDAPYVVTLCFFHSPI